MVISKNSKKLKNPKTVFTDTEVGVLLEDVNAKFDLVVEQLGSITENVTEIKGDINILKEDMGMLQVDVGILKGTVTVLKEDVSEIKFDLKKKPSYDDFSKLERRVTRLESKRIQ